MEDKLSDGVKKRIGQVRFRFFVRVVEPTVPIRKRIV